MTLDELLPRLLEDASGIARGEAVLTGRVRLIGAGEAELIGIHGGKPLGIEDALALAGRVLEIAEQDDDAPLLVLIDGSSQRMSKRDELLGLNEYLAHLGKSLLLAARGGRRTIGLIYGGAAAGAFIATALSTAELIAVEGAHPEVMDLPSMSKVTKLSLEVLQEKAKATPVFAPGADNLVQVGAVLEIWSASDDLAARLSRYLSDPAPTIDRRDELGRERGGRSKAAEIARRVREAVHARA